MLKAKLEYLVELQYWAKAHGKQVTYHVRLAYTPAPLEFAARDPKKAGTEMGVVLELLFPAVTDDKNIVHINNLPYSANSTRQLTPQEEKKLLTALRGK